MLRRQLCDTTSQSVMRELKGYKIWNKFTLFADFSFFFRNDFGTSLTPNIFHLYQTISGHGQELKEQPVKAPGVEKQLSYWLTEA